MASVLPAARPAAAIVLHAASVCPWMSRAGCRQGQGQGNRVGSGPRIAPGTSDLDWAGSGQSRGRPS
ncbi:hypothetical protein Y1Q_0016267 [Alligator mississippiensis]|uniref:Uncharacterized protein n=1 Tax=Alligator mississippiensis TaxID=8496 RepID=A0A151N8B8_ALLMI|nr:hypothetical protein Y1Q_0016267 [Alligator mississippiensis]